MTIVTKRFHKNGTVTVRYDFSDFCKRCLRKPRGKMQKNNYERYKPFCSYHCQEWFKLEEAQRYINSKLREGN